MYAGVYYAQPYFGGMGLIPESPNDTTVVTAPAFLFADATQIELSDTFASLSPVNDEPNEVYLGEESITSIMGSEDLQ